MKQGKVLFSESFIFTLREDPKIADCKSHKFLLKGSYLFMVSSGIYSYLPLGWKVLNKISNIIRKHMNLKGAYELSMTHLQPIEIWRKTNRDKDLGDVMFRFKDRKGRDLCLGPTHEEEITEIVRKYVSSYNQLPFILYQIQTKFRDEPRPRYGLIRSCEFVMKDAYSFDIDEEGLDKSYQKMLSAYQDIFRECGLEVIVVEADPGVMGGNVSHEFMVPAQIGEDALFFCEECKKYFKEEGSCPQCKKDLKVEKMIEIGHIFKLGTKYSLAQEAYFLDQKGKRIPIIMGCYGIGVSRLLPAIVETNCDEKGIIWPKSVSPFDLVLIVLDKTLLSEAFLLSDDLERCGFDILVDDRDESAGVKFNDALLLGIPYLIIMGKNYMKEKKLDVEIRRTKDELRMSKEELINFLKNEYNK
jgi:prolyl-tRNA synthetase